MKKNNNTYWLIAGIINLLTALIHLIGGQLTLVNPLVNSNLSSLEKTEWLGAWHAITFILFMTGYYLIKSSKNPSKPSSSEVNFFIGIFYILFSVSFVGSSIFMGVFAPQWILLLPIGILSILGSRKER